MAALIIGAFALFGQQILLYLGIRLPSLEAAGGLLLLLVALDLLRGEVEGLSGEGQGNIAFVPLGTPLLAGPGAIAAIMVFMREASTTSERVGVALGRRARRAVADAAVRGRGQAGARPAPHRAGDPYSGLLLTAIAVQLVADAVREFIREGV